MTTAEALFRLHCAVAALRWVIALAIMPGDMRPFARRALDIQLAAYTAALAELRAQQTERKRREAAPWN